jgi:ribonuclease-3
MSDSQEADANVLETTELEAALGYEYASRTLLATALTHSSRAHEHYGTESNERLEFLGDSVIGLVVAHLLYEAHPEWAEGQLTRALHRLVDRPGLASLARRIDVGPHIRLGRTELSSGGSEKPSILADTMEALIGAMYLDGGLAPVEALARDRFSESLAAEASPVGLDPKTRFQEWVMAEFGSFPAYQLAFDTGVEGDENRFTTEVSVEKHLWASGNGRSKRQAEQNAASAAYTRRDELAKRHAEATDD